MGKQPQIPDMVGRVVKFMYHAVQRSVQVERQKIDGGFVYITGRDYARDGEYRTFKFIPEEFRCKGAITIH